MEQKICQCCREKDGSKMKGEIRLEPLCEVLHSDKIRDKELATMIDFDTNELVVGHYNMANSIPDDYLDTVEKTNKYLDFFEYSFPSKEWRMAIKYCPFCGQKLEESE